eukprot:TRINITY_DN46210_c0_g1_i1.p1 TRINITY_DN46210_c0_g1~~TRINITY_DN46210_c0_g1_i1.p1  ORF type:complete len:279 (-),score=81.48 TRINITY_DN46210_c0_g1_i1:90-926(-)
MGVCRSKDKQEPAEPGPKPVPEGKTDSGGVDMNSPAMMVTMTKDAWKEPMMDMLTLAINGKPGVIRSARASRNALLRETNGDADAAAQLIISSEDYYQDEVRSFLLPFIKFDIPGVGFPEALVVTSWMEMRRICVIASLFGHDLHCDRVQGRVLLATAGMRSFDIMAVEHVVPWALDQLWAALCTAAAVPIASVLPVGSIITGLLKLNDKATTMIVIKQFKEDATPVPKSEWEQELEPQYVLADAMKLLWKEGKQSLHDMALSVQDSVTSVTDAVTGQ